MKSMVKDELDNFFASMDLARRISTDEISIYIRKSSRCIDDQLYFFLDVASVQVLNPNKGIFTRYLNEIVEFDPRQNIFNESVYHPALEKVASKFSFQKQMVGSSSTGFNLYLLRNNDTSLDAFGDLLLMRVLRK